MLKLSMRSVTAHKLRLVLSMLSVLLGTAFISASMMFTASLNSVFDSALEDALANIDAFGPRVTTERLTELRSNPEIAKVALQQNRSVVVANSERKPYQTGSGTSSVIPWYDSETAVGYGNTLEEGSLPADGQVLVSSSGKNYGIKLGDQLLVVDSAGQKEFTVSGFYTSQSQAKSWSSSIELGLPEEQYLGNYGEAFYSVAVNGTESHGEELTTKLKEAYPEVGFQSAAEMSATLTDQIGQALDFINYFLVAFGLIALLVATFLIANTFAMLVAQRMREFALLRAIGVSKRQLTTSVVAEAVVVGLLGSIIGVFAGAGLVQIIQIIMGKLGMAIPASLDLTVQNVVTPLVLGTLVTIVSAWAPARRAGQVHPVEAMRSTETATEASLVLRTIVSAIILLIGVGLCAWAVSIGGETKPRAIGIGFGAVFVFIGVFLAAPALSIPVISLLSIKRGLGKLAATNSRRNPKRTATTAFALTLGIALVAAISMLSASMQSSIKDLVTKEITANYVLRGPQDNSFPIPIEAQQKVKELPGVERTVPISFAEITLGDATNNAPPVYGQNVSYLAGGDLTGLVDFGEVTGSIDLTETGVFIASQRYAEEEGWKIGDVVPVMEAGQKLAEAKLIGTYEGSRILGDVVISDQTVVLDPDSTRWILVAGEVPQEQLTNAVEDYLIIRVQTASEYAGEQVSMINQMLYILYALLGLSVVVAILGIVNTLALNVIERRQEIGMLRAVGMQRRQVRWLITIESVQIALFGAVLGIAVGVSLGWAFLKVLSGEGLESISIPYSLVGGLFIASGFVGVFAALWPASRAAKTPPLEAIRR